MARAGNAAKRSRDDVPAESPERAALGPLPPPKKRLPLLIVSAALVACWTLFLLWLVLRQSL